jgi:flagellar basal body P-ring formation protein FlgA
MRTLRFFVILCCFYYPFFSVQADDGQGATKVLTQNDLQEIFTKIIKQNVPDLIEEIRINSFAAQPQSLSVPEGTVSYRLANQFYSASPGKKFLSVIISVNGRECGQVKMYGDLHFWGTVVFASHPLSRNSIIAAGDIETDFRDISMLGAGLIERPDLAIGKQLSKSLRAGDIMFNYQLKNQILVKRGDKVMILAKSGSVQVSAPGEVKNAGAAGDIVRVKNLMSRRILQARVVDEGVVEVDL